MKQQLQRSRTHLVIGKTGTGKTTMVKNLLHSMSYIDYGLVIAPTHSSYLDFATVFPPAAVHENTDLTPLVNMLDTQKKILKKRGNRKIRYLCVVLDDCVADDKVMKHKIIKDIAYNGRHFHITSIWTTQYILEVPKAIRMNINYVYQLRELSKNNIETLHKEYFSIVGGMPTFIKILNAITDDRGCLFFDNCTQSTSPSDLVFWFKGKSTKDLGPFKVGCKSMYRIIARYMRPFSQVNDVDNIEEEVMNMMRADEPEPEPEPTVVVDTSTKFNKLKSGRRSAIAVTIH